MADESRTTARVRVVVAVDSEGKWSAVGASHFNDDDARECCYIDDLGTHLAYHWIEADVPIPAPQTILGKVHARA